MTNRQQPVQVGQDRPRGVPRRRWTDWYTILAMTAPRTPTPRYLVWLPEEMHAQFTVIRERRRHQGSQLFWCWLRDAVALVKAGQTTLTTHLLPTADIVVAGTKEAKWSQNKAEHDEWEQLLMLGGTSIEAVLQARVGEYIACDGDVTVMGASREDGPSPPNPSRKLVC